MPEERSTTPDLVELVRHLLDAASWLDGDAFVRFFAPDAVFLTGVGRFEGRDAIRGYIEDFNSSYDERSFAPDEVHDLGNGVAWFSAEVTGRLRGTSAEVHLRFAVVVTHAGGVVSQWTDYATIDEARAAAERLAEERGQAMSESLDLVRSIYGDWERGEFDSADWAHPDIEYVSADGPDPGAWTGLADMAENFRAWLGLWEEFRLTADEYRQFGTENVIVLDHLSGRGKTSGLDLGQIQSRGAWVFHIRDGKVMRMTRYLDRDRALADLGLTE